MKSQNYNLIRYDADEGKVFDWKEPRFVDEENTERDHLYAKSLFIGAFDSIDNYIEIDAPSGEI